MISEEGILNISTKLLPKEEMLATSNKKSILKIGLLAENMEDETRVCLAPESVGLLVDNGLRVLVQSKAGIKAGYTDMEYADQGGIISTSKEVLQCDFLLKVSPLSLQERESLNKNQVLLTSLQELQQDRDYFTSLVDKKATAIAFEQIKDNTNSYPIIRSMGEIVGTTGIQIAAYYLAHPIYGCGSMLGGIPGVCPTEIVIIGAGTVGEFAAKAAIGMGAQIKVFDNSIYRLRRLQNNLKQNIFTSTLQPQTLLEAMKKAHVVVGALRQSTESSSPKIPTHFTESMKQGSLILDVSIDEGGSFESSHLTTHKDPVYQLNGITHYCVPNIASKVPFTASNALSNFFTPLLLEISATGGITNYLKNSPGLRHGVYAYNGIITKQKIGATFGFNYRDIDLLLAVLH